jgi:hypothetical protein
VVGDGEMNIRIIEREDEMAVAKAKTGDQFGHEQQKPEHHSDQRNIFPD